jgi:hypothetical protein
LRSSLLATFMIVLFLLLPQANASFTKPPTFDLKTTSNLAGATDAVYTLHFENADQSEDATNASVTIPAGYSINQKFITDQSGIKAGSASGHCPIGSAQANFVTTTTPGHFTISFMSGATVDITVIEPTATTPGTMEFSFFGTYAVMNYGCYAELTTVEGFFINPSSPGTYAWAPSTANPKSGPPVTMGPGPGFSQTITITGPAVTTTTSITTTTPELPAPVIVLIALVALSVVVAKRRRH